MAAVIVGSRASRLARAQVREWIALMRRQFPNVEFKQRTILEGGDKDRKTPTLAQVARSSGGSAFSTRQEAALLTGEVDVIVHSLKDLPTAMPEGLALMPTPGRRQDPRDTLCGNTLQGLPKGARVGTGAPRRIGQLLAVRPDLEMVPIRGNVPPRLARASGPGALDAVVLAAAGLNRLGLDSHISEHLPLDVFPPSPGQAALGIQVRKDSEIAKLLVDTGNAIVDAEVRAERSMLAELHGGCSVPIGAFGKAHPDGTLTLSAQVSAVDGSRHVTAHCSGSVRDPEGLGRRVADELLTKGAEAILAAIRPEIIR
ncbi:hydroxymethylbilane synthase [Streptomyces olivoreticuli]|uniref:hydroxymethylbilane synthase n=1 Tax=Streptomyces olivoreticuli TaxID=68246 RepID=UPI000E26AA06|nr:hydroxymethylbilane synthase [Streptomyces olivoreticuli]